MTYIGHETFRAKVPKAAGSLKLSGSTQTQGSAA